LHSVAVRPFRCRVRRFGVKECSRHFKTHWDALGSVYFFDIQGGQSGALLAGRLPTRPFTNAPSAPLRHRSRLQRARCDARWLRGMGRERELRPVRGEGAPPGLRRSSRITRFSSSVVEGESSLEYTTKLVRTIKHS